MNRAQWLLYKWVYYSTSEAISQRSVYTYPYGMLAVTHISLSLSLSILLGEGGETYSFHPRPLTIAVYFRLRMTAVVRRGPAETHIYDLRQYGGFVHRDTVACIGRG